MTRCACGTGTMKVRSGPSAPPCGPSQERAAGDVSGITDPDVTQLCLAQVCYLAQPGSRHGGNVAVAQPRAVLDWLRLARHQAVDSYLPDSDPRAPTWYWRR